MTKCYFASHSKGQGRRESRILSYDEPYIDQGKAAVTATRDGWQIGSIDWQIRVM